MRMKEGDTVRIRKLTPELRATSPFVDGMQRLEGRVGTAGPFDPSIRDTYVNLGHDDDNYFWHESHLEPYNIESVLKDAGWREVRSGTFVHPKDSSCYVSHGEVWINGTCGFMISTTEQAVRWLAFLEVYHRD